LAAYGLQDDKGNREELAHAYGNHGLSLLPMRATFEDRTNGVEASVLERMHTGGGKRS
jgi:hypothetical protein